MKHYADKSPKDWTARQKAQWQKAVGSRIRVMIAGKYGKRSEFRFAKAINISQGTLSDIINGNSTPSAYTLIKMVDAIGPFTLTDDILGRFSDGN